MMNRKCGIKKFLCGTLAFAMCMGMTACISGKGGQTDNPANSSGNSEVVSSGTPGGGNSESTQPVASGGNSKVVSPLYAAGELSDKNLFRTAFLKETAKEKENFVISPLSVKIALNMAALGAENDTEKELLTLFGYEDCAQMQKDSQTLMTALNREDGSISVNNSLWVDNKKDKISKEYVDEAEKIFSAEVFHRNLSEREIVKEFNGWIDKQTKGLIPKMIDEPFSTDARMLLVNALYFKNDWKYKFAPEKTRDMIFHGTKGDATARGMYRSGYMDYAMGDVFKSVSLEYVDGSVMNLYLPGSESESLSGILEKLTPKELAEAMDLEYNHEKKVNLTLPKFECDYNESLKNTLTVMGITQAFDPYNADFAGMIAENVEDKCLYIWDVIHASKIICDEKGTEAAAVTIVETFDTAALIMEEEEIIEFVVDRPFLYEIKSPEGETLFMGVISAF